MEEEVWVPRTELGRKVQKGEVTSIKEIMEEGIPILEIGIVDRLIPHINSEILDINRVQRRDRSGRKLRYRVVVVVGNKDGYVGIGQGKAKEVYGSIQKAIQAAKKNLICVRRGCGSWECGCGNPHTVPFRVTGKSGSVEVTLIPAPRGVDIAAGDVAKTILQLAGIEDAWSKVKGNTQTTLNFAMAVFDALIKTNAFQASQRDLEKLGVSLAEIEAIQIQRHEESSEEESSEEESSEEESSEDKKGENTEDEDAESENVKE